MVIAFCASTTLAQTPPVLIDGLDNQKTINERIIANDSESLNKRAELLKLTEQQIDDSFNAQVQILQKFTKESIDANNLIATSDAVTLNEKVKALGLDELLQNRLLEVIRERRLAVQDTNEAEKDLLTTQRESADLRVDIATQLETLHALSK